MPTERGPTEKQHVCERAIVEHVADLVVRNATDRQHRVHSPTTPDGEPVEEKVRKEWDPQRNGGLATFCR